MSDLIDKVFRLRNRFLVKIYKTVSGKRRRQNREREKTCAYFNWNYLHALFSPSASFTRRTNRLSVALGYPITKNIHLFINIIYKWVNDLLAISWHGQDALMMQILPTPTATDGSKSYRPQCGSDWCQITCTFGNWLNGEIGRLFSQPKALRCRMHRDAIVIGKKRRRAERKSDIFSNDMNFYSQHGTTQIPGSSLLCAARQWHHAELCAIFFALRFWIRQ